MFTFHNDKTLEQKIELIKTANEDSNLLGRLFYQARNQGIWRLQKEVVDYFNDHKLKVRCNWKEDYRFTTLYIYLLDKYEHCRAVYIERETYSHKLGDSVSNIVYSVKSVQSGEYYRYKKPKVAKDFDSILQTDVFKDWISHRVYSLVNYPFEYNSYSSI